MARGVNKVILVGNVGNDPETKYTQGGMAIAAVSLATTSVRKDRDGNTQEQTQWHRVKAFGKLAEIIAEYVRKGSQIYVEGSIKYDKYTGNDGVEKHYTEIIADEVQFLGGREREDAPRKPAGRKPPNDGLPPASDFNDDDIPF